MVAVIAVVLVLCVEVSRIGSGRFAFHTGILKPSAIRMSVISSSRGSLRAGPL